MEDPEVFANGIHCSFIQYANYKHYANILMNTRVTFPLPPPAQGSTGDCWFLVAVAGLQCFYPNIFCRLVKLDENNATICFPRFGQIKVNYVLPVHSFVDAAVVKIQKAEDLYWALLEKAACLLLNKHPNPNLDRRRSRHGLLTQPRVPHYIDLHGGKVSDALQILSPIVTHAPQIITSFSPVTMNALAARGLFFLEVPRAGSWHSLLLLATTDEHFLAYDPWGETILHPKTGCNVYYFPLDRHVSSSIIFPIKIVNSAFRLHPI